jgi:cysteinyl-tRNA synthetase
MHNNMVTMNGQKMGKSLGNAISCRELFSGDHKLLTQGFSPMSVRFFILQSHYRSTLDFSNEALVAAEKGYKRLMNAGKVLMCLSLPEGHQAQDEKRDAEMRQFCADCTDYMNDDFNTAQALSALFEIGTVANACSHGQAPLEAISVDTLNLMKKTFHDFAFDVLGLKEESQGDDLTEGLVELLIDLRQRARENRDFATSDQIRDRLAEMGVMLKDSKDGSTWSLN